MGQVSAHVGEPTCEGICGPQRVGAAPHSLLVHSIQQFDVSGGVVEPLVVDFGV
ncbi:hypothetical protein [Micromonospora sp. RTP1Z1]|uniref:hypothetical protein n=1 Tax=Micromonospora sp. RTP1Z1 TaxID=2994043 RepID=UPI0029C9A048|nr:hypothetical protein [Micromonospora sp. RTP1Z1]